jgi:Restriction endonuclease S subunits
MEKKKVPKIRFEGFTDDWEQYKLDDIVQITMGQSPDGSTYSDKPSDYILVQGNADLKNGWVEPRVWTTQVTKKAEVGDLIMSVRAPAGAMGKTAYNVVIGRGVAAIKGNEFIYQLLVKMDSNEYWKILSCGSTFESLNSDNIKNTNVIIPKKDEQETIGLFFNNLDNLITFYQHKYEKLKLFKEAMLDKMFPKNGEKVPEIRFKGFTDDWEQRKLSEIATMHARIGWQNLRTSEFLDNGDYMLITGTDFEDGAINYATCHYVERERYEQDKHIQVSNGSILITKDGTLGKVAYIQGLSMPATLNAGVFNVVIKNENEVDNKYLYQYLKAPFLMDYVDKKATGGTIKHLNQNILVDFPVDMSTKAEQQAIGQYFDNLDRLVTLHHHKYEKLKLFKEAMLNKMFI